MRVIRWAVIVAMWIAIICFGIYFVDGVSRGSERWIGAGALGFMYFAWVTGNKLDQHQRRIERLERELGKHQRHHGHMTEFHE